MTDNNFVVNKIREQMLAEYGGDIHATIHDMELPDRRVGSGGPRPLHPLSKKFFFGSSDSAISEL